MAFNNYTSGFVVGEVTAGVQAAKITSAAEGVVTAWAGASAGSIPTVEAVSSKINTEVSGKLDKTEFTAWSGSPDSEFKGTAAKAASATSALNAGTATSAGDADTLDGLQASEFASAADVTTLQGYFTEGSALSAVNATSASKAATAGTATSAGEAAKLSTARTIESTGDVTWSVSFDGSENVTSDATINNVPWSAAAGLANSIIASGESTGFAAPSAVAAAIKSAISNVYKLKGSNTVDGINGITAPEVGDVWNVTDSGTIKGKGETSITVVAGDNVVWDGTNWDKLAGIVDLQGYVQKSEISAVSGEVTAHSGNWNNVYTSVNTNSGNWQNSYTALTSTSSEWDSVYDTVYSYSGDWQNKLFASAFDTWSGSTDSVFSGTAKNAEFAQLAENANSATIAADTEKVNGTAAADVVTMASQGATAYTWVTANSANVQTASGYAKDWNDNKDAVIGSANSGAEASAWIELNKANIASAETAAADWTATKGNLVISANAGSAASAWIDDNKTKLVTSAFGAVTVASTTAEGGTTATYNASALKDTIKFAGGNNITLAATSDAAGNPTIVINGATTAEFPEINGGNGVTAEALKDASNVITAYNVSGVDATSSTKGVVLADYYTSADGLIHLF